MRRNDAAISPLEKRIRTLVTQVYNLGRGQHAPGQDRDD